jgi:predicted permease
MQALLFDLRHTLRSLLNQPFFTLTTVVMLGMGLGLVLFMFGAIQSLVLQSPPYPNADQIAHFGLRNSVTGERNIRVGINTYLDIAESQQSLAHIGAFYSGTINLSDQQRPTRFEGSNVTHGVFETLGINPVLGRVINEQDMQVGAPAVAVLGYDLWQQRYGGDASVIGRPVRVNSRNATIIGVMPEGFRFPEREDIWIPMNLDVLDGTRNSAPTVEVIGRIAAGKSSAQAETEFQALLERVNQQYPQARRADTAVVKPLAENMVSEIYARVLNIMLAAVSLVLLVACANVAGLLSARAATKQRERTIRSVMGATRWRLFWEGLLEAGVITCLAAAVGLVIAKLCGNWFMSALASTEHPPPSWALHFHIDAYLIGITIVAVALTTLLSGFVPAWRSSKIPENQIMREGGHGAISSGLGRLGKCLIAIEIALSLVLLVSAGLVIRTVIQIENIDTGADVHRTLTGRLALMDQHYRSDARVTTQFLERLQEDLSNAPGIAMATVTDTLPMTNVRRGWVATANMDIEDEDHLPMSVPIVVADNYFNFFRIPLVSGRVFSQHDDAESELVMVVSQDLAQRLWPQESAEGKTLTIKTGSGATETRTVIGVVGEVEYDGQDLGFGSGNVRVGAYYLPLTQSKGQFWSVAIHTLNEPHTVASVLRDVVARQDSDMPVYWIRSMDDWIEIASFRHQLLATIFIGFGIVALCLTASGLYALLSYTVTRKTREIGVHRAMGAPTWVIIRNITKDSLLQVAVGSFVGLGLSMLFAQLLSYVLFDVSPFDPVSFLLAVLFFALVCLTASIVPAFKAVRITPMQALRYE